MNILASEKPKSPHVAWSVPEAFLGVLTLMAVWDGHKASSRLRALHAFIEHSPLLNALGEKGLVQLQSDVVKRFEECKPSNALERACAVLPGDMRESAYAACVDIVGGSGVLSELDRDLLGQLRALLGLNETRTSDIERVILLKNRF